MVFKWIQIVLFLAALLQIPAAAVEAKTFYSTVRVGDDTTLPCDDLLEGQQNCEGTDWRFLNSANAESVLLVRRGQVAEDAGATSGRLSVTEDCSLVVKKVTEEDAGQYLCQQFRPGGPEGTEAFVIMSLLSMIETKNGDDATLFCSLTTHAECTLRVKWLFQGIEVRGQSVRTSQRLCYAFAVFPSDHHMYKSRRDSLQCEVTAGDKVQTFRFSLQPSAPRPTEDGLTAETTPASENEPSGVRDCRGCSGLDFIMLSLRVAELVLITLLTVLLFRARGNQRPPDDITVRYDGDDDTVNCENAGEPSASVRLH
ncbi:uncharacterized protein LOC117824562 [Notolabrus celidotus]|uniref:uncharacterized protein LOC117824562 n=1 Tax=Notolabrus celidotus TaxID=1203425 RepID=UPI00148F7635|nr:uncharacterized protein LOC117824562 [Notolabrus celidotus]